MPIAGRALIRRRSDALFAPRSSTSRNASTFLCFRHPEPGETRLKNAMASDAA
jgi:hypothetical protein